MPCLWQYLQSLIELLLSFHGFLSQVVFSYLSNLFTFESLFILAGALHSIFWTQQFLQRYTFCLYVYLGHPLDSLGSPLVLGWCSKTISGSLQPAIPGQVVVPGGQPDPCLQCTWRRAGRVTFSPSFRYCQSTFCALAPHILNPVWFLPLPG